MGSKIERFEDLEVWKEGVRLAVALYKQLATCKDFGLRDQLQRSAVSIPSNIAEGYERSSNKEFIQFLHIAKGSCSELRTQLYIAREVGVIEHKRVTEFLEQTRKISAMLYKLIKTRKQNF